MSSSNINSNPIRAIIWSTWLLASIFYAYQYILRVLPSVMMENIMQQFSLDAAIYGQFTGIYYIGYALMHIPLGILLDRIGPKKIMAGCIFINVLGMLPIMFATHWSLALLGRLLIGIGSSGAILSVFKIIQLSFSTEKFTRMLSFTATIGLLGAIYGVGPVDYLSQQFGYKNVTAFLAVFGVILSIVAYLITPQFAIKQNSSILNSIKSVFSNHKVLAICLFAGLMVGPMEGFADAWGKHFLQIKYNLDSTVAAGFCSTIFIGMCFGAPILSYIAAKTNDLITISIAGLTMALCFAFIISGYANPTTMSIMFGLIGVGSSYQILAIFKATSSVPENAVGLTSAIVNMIIMLFGYAFHSTIGAIISLYGNSDPLVGFKYAITTIPIALVMGAVGFLLIFWQEGSKDLAAVQSKSFS